MISPSFKYNSKTARRGDRSDQTDALTLGFEHRALLDVELQIRLQGFGFALKLSEISRRDAQA